MFAGYRTLVLAISILMILVAGQTAAQVLREPEDPLDALVFVDPRLQPARAGVPFDSADPGIGPEVRAGWTDFLADAGGSWKSYVDPRTGRIDFAEGSGLPWIPNAGKGKAPNLGDLERLARGFMPRIAGMMGIKPSELVIAPERSGPVADHLVLVDFDVQRDGLRVEGARVVFRVNHGNLIQFGTENLPPPGTATPVEKYGRKEALTILNDYVGGFSAADQFVDGGSARLVPLTERQGAGQRRGLARAWEFVFRRRGSPGTWRARIDAGTGDLLELVDVNRYAKATGGVYPVSYIFNDETVRPMPYADLSSGGFTNSAGQFTYGGGTVTSTLSGQFVDVNDQCGLISQSSGTFGNIALGTSAGTDCTTPGSGGAGNTHAARTQFYHVNRIKEVGRGWLPSNSWLSAQLPVNVNIFDYCNAYWNGFSINFFRSGGGCGNTGEIAGVSLHEYAHGLDDNDGIAIGDLGTAEAYSDVTAALMVHDSCMGPGFFGGNCTGYGDACTSCSGVRDLDWAKRVSNTPHTVDNFTRQLCYSSYYAGPCGSEGHCESYVASEAIWDLAARDLPSPGSAAAWMTTERLWYLSRPSATSAFTCNTSSIPWTSDGCTTGSWWRTMRAVDDDDGNLANGTPHSCQLFAAFNRHGIACASDPGANVCFSGCTPPTAPALALTPGDRQTALSWTSSGAGVTYDVFRSEAGCGSSFIKIADSQAGTSYTDLAVANGSTYSYTVVAHATGNGACAAPPAACQSVVPQAPPCTTPPSAPTGLAATVQGVDRISLSWNAVPGASFYELFRAPSSSGPWTSIANVTPPAVTHLDIGLAPGTAYFYVVRAATGETCLSGDSNQASAATINCQTGALYQTDFESGSGLADWIVAELNGSGSAASWRGIQACTAHSGSKIFRFGGDASCTASYAPYQHGAARPQGTAGIQVPSGAALTSLSFWHRRDFEYGYDGGTLTLSVDGGPYVQVPPAALSGAAYDSAIYASCPPPGTAGTPVFTGYAGSSVKTDVDLDAACNAATGTNLGCAGHTIRIGFKAITDCVASYSGWFLDDVSVSACVPHGCTGAPVIGTATTPAANQVLLTWGNGAPASTSFNIYRAFGTCAAPGPFTKIATGVSGASYLDSPVSGSTQYAYRVAGLDATGVCESDLSACVDAVPTGPCTLAPQFAGLASAKDPVQTNCSVALSWSPAVSRCSGGTVSYDVFRSTSPGFTPATGNRIATGVTSTSFLDAGTLQYETAYYYVVRAADSVSGISDGNTAYRSAAPTGPLTLPVTITESFEAADGFDHDGWSRFTIYGSMSWSWSTARSQSPSHSWYVAGYGYYGDGVLMSPPVQVASDTVLSFWHTYEFEDCFDGGTLEISTDGGFKWAPVPASAFLAGGYTGQVHGNNPIYGRNAWCYGTLGAMTEVRVSLANWSGKTAQLRWHAGEDYSVASPGWFVDTVVFSNARVTNGCISAPPQPLDFYTATPCRILDTRSTHPPALQPNQMRTFQVSGVCGIPATAKAISANLTAVSAGALGDLNIFRADSAPPIASAISFIAGATRGNNAVVSLSETGTITVKCNSSAPVDFILDVNGYYQE